MSEEQNSVTLFGKTGMAVGTPNVKRFLSGASNIAATSMRSEHPYVSFGKDGVWTFGQEQEAFDPQGRYAIDSNSILQGWIAWVDKKAHIHMVPVGEPMPDPATLPELGVAYDKGYSTVIKALSGKQKGQLFLYRTNSFGGRDFFESLIRDIGQATVMFGLDRSDDLALPVIQLENSFYTHKEWGKTYKPEFRVVEWLRYSDGQSLAQHGAGNGHGRDGEVIDAEIIEPEPKKPANAAGRRKRPTA